MVGAPRESGSRRHSTVTKSVGELRKCSPGV